MKQKRMSKVKLPFLLGLAIVMFIIPAFVFFIYGGGIILFPLYVFGVPLIVWVPIAFICYGIGFWLLIKCLKGKSGFKVLILSEMLMSLPLCVLILGEFFGKYKGP